MDNLDSKDEEWELNFVGFLVKVNNFLFIVSHSSIVLCKLLSV